MPPTRQGGHARGLAVVLGVVVALVLIAWAAVAVQLPPARVNALVREQLARTLAREVRFEGAAVGLWPPVRLTVRSPALAEPGGFAAGAACRAARLHLDLDVLALLSRRVVVRRLELDQGVLHLVQNPDGSTNLEGLVKPPLPGARGAAPMDLEVKALALRDLRLVLDDRKSRRRSTVTADATLGFSSLAGGSRLSTRGEARLTGYAFGPDTIAVATRLNQSLAKLVLEVKHEGAFDTNAKRLALERLELGLGKARVTLSGTVDDPGPRARLDLRARGDGLDFGEVLAFLAAADARLVSGVRGSGRMRFDVAVRGALGAGTPPAITGSLAVSDASFRYPRAPVAVEDLGFTARFAPDSVGIGDLAASVSGQPVRAVLIVTRFADPAVRFAVRGNVDLAAVAPMLAAKDSKLSGRLALDVRGAGRAKDPSGMALDGRADLERASVASPTLPKPVEQVSGRIEFSRTRAAVRNLTAKAGQSSFTLDGTVTRPLALLAKPGSTPPSEVSFRFDSPHLDVAEVLPAGKGGMLPLNATGGGTVSIARLRNQKLDLANVRAEVALEPNWLLAPSFSMDAYGGKVAGSASFDLANPASPAFALKGRVDSLSADAFLSSLTPARGVIGGSVSSAFDLSGDGTEPDQLKRTLTAVGLAAVIRGRIGSPVLEAIAGATRIPSLKELRFDEARLPFRVVRGQVVTDSVRFSGPSCGNWSVAGAVGFDGRLDYAVSATLPKEVVERLGARAALAAGALADEQGRLLLDLRVTGPATAPRVSWNTTAMRERLAGRASQALREQSRRLAEELTRRLPGAPGDSAKPLAPGGGAGAPDLGGTVREKAGDLLRGLFGRNKSAAPDTARDSLPR